ncbi:MAG: hypothetical protein NTW87_29960 [Planctomycetota bacterium]|nr:hypothetical protein [Planctomycetota bacterium]
MLAAGVLLGLNLRELTDYYDEYGWPLMWLVLPDRRFTDAPIRWNGHDLARNAVYWCAILFDIAVLSERCVRREWGLRRRLPAAGIMASLVMLLGLPAMPWLWPRDWSCSMLTTLVCGTAVVVAAGVIVEATLARSTARKTAPRIT